MIHPDLHNWQQAKKSALAIAANMKAEIVQSPDGKTKTVFLGKRSWPCVSWYAAYCVLHRIRLDQIGTKAQDDPPPVAKHAQPIPMAIILPDLPAPNPAKPVYPVAKPAPRRPT